MTDQELLLTSILKCTRHELILDQPELSEAQQRQYEQMIRLVESGFPIQYVIGETSFMGYDIKVNKEVLIPRPETELLVDHAVKAADQNRSISILDIGTGSGCVAIALAKLLPQSKVLSMDVSESALKLAEENAWLNHVENQIDFIHEDIFTYSQIEKPFDMIVSNPPYIPTEDVEALPEMVRKEPVLALDGGFDGLQFYRRIIMFAGIHLKSKGLLVCEIGDGQHDAIAQLIHSTHCFSTHCFHKDYVGTQRIVMAWKN